MYETHSSTYVACVCGWGGFMYVCESVCERLYSKLLLDWLIPQRDNFEKYVLL